VNGWSVNDLDETMAQGRADQEPVGS
jgi:hypothetical protein